MEKTITRWLEIDSKEFKDVRENEKSKIIIAKLKERGFDLTKHIHMSEKKGIYRYIQTYLHKE